MLSFFRRFLSSWIVLGLLGLVMIAFIITGVGTPTGLGDLSGGPERVAEAGDRRITTPELSQQLNRQLELVRQQQPEADMGMLIRTGLFEQVVDQMIAALALNAFADEQGVTASDRMIDGEIASIPAFHNVAGKFDPDVFRRVLEAERVTEEQVRNDFLTQLVQRQVLMPVSGAPKVPEGLARAYSELMLETRTGVVGLVPAQAVGPGAQPSDAEVATYFKQQTERYTIPERRVLRYAAFGRPDVAAAAQATEAEIAAAYKANAAQYGPKETRTVSQLVLPDEGAAKAFAAKVQAGTSFADAATQAGFSPSDTALGPQTREGLARVASPAIAAAAFAIAKGQITAPTRSPLGWHIVRVEDITTTPGRPLAAVRDELAAQISQRKAEEALATLVTRIEDAIADGASFEEVVRNNKLQAQETPPITAGGTAPGIAGFQFPPDLAPVLKPGFDMSSDEDPVVETLTPNQRFAVLQVSRVVAAAPPPFDQVRDRVRADLIQERSLARAGALAKQLADKINAGMPIREAFAKAGVSLPPVQSITAQRRQMMQQQQGAPPPVRMIFSLPKGKTRTLAAPANGGYFVVHVEEIVPGDVSNAPGLVVATQAQFGSVFGAEYAEQFARAAERDVDVERNKGAIKRLRDQLQSNTAVQ
jgi:peptidyl-prolyl cis-trans isomerase D